MAPQVSHGGPTYMSDVYSFGCVLLCMSTSQQYPLIKDPLDLEPPGLGPLSCLKEDPQGQHPGPLGKWTGSSPCIAGDPPDACPGPGQHAQQTGACGRVMSVPRWPDDTYPLLRQVGESCLVRDPTQRPSFSEMMQVGV